jgi:putative nucleotidyltransferase with HDIG domain
VIDPIPFLHTLAQTLSALALYPEGHSSRARSVETLYERVLELLRDGPVRFSFLGDEVVFGVRPVRELREWEWSTRLSGIGVQRLQLNEQVTQEELEEFLDMVLARVAMRTIDTSEARATRPAGIRYGLIGIRGVDATGTDGDIPTATITYDLADEADTVRWMHEELTSGKELPLMEAEAVVRALSVAMHGDQQVMLPLLRLRKFDEYTTTHSLNVSVLSMGLAEYLGLGAQDVRAFGVAGLLHDLGKVRIPLEILNKPGKLTDEERAVMNRHPVDGASIIIESEPDLDMAAVVAYEHHIMLNGSGYPSMHYERDCHHGSKLVHVCDVYDALRTDRPYRDAWPKEEVLKYVAERSGVEFDPTIAGAFAKMMEEWEPALASHDTGADAVTAEDETPSGPADASAAGETETDQSS